MPNKRTQDRIKNNLGIIQGGIRDKSRKCRTPELEVIDVYLNNREYDGRMPWAEAEQQDEYVPIKKRIPTLKYNLPLILTNRLSAKLLGEKQFPTMIVEDDPDTTDLIRLIKKQSMFETKCLEGCKWWLAYGSVFMRFKLINGKIFLERYNPKHCYPIFDSAKELISIRIQYVFEDHNDLDDEGKPIEKWYRMDLSRTVDTLYDNPEYEADSEPMFSVVSSNVHDLGFVQGEWWMTGDNKHGPDGPSLTEPIHGFTESISYNLSQSDKATAYGMDPQLVLKGMDEEEVTLLIKSSESGWNVGREGEASFLESSGSGLEHADQTEQRFDLKVQNITRVIMLDPEKLVASAQSGKAMEILHGPMMELISELRPMLEDGITKLMQKMIATLVIFNKRGALLAIQMPPQWVPASLDIEITWGEVFPKTMQDLREKVGIMMQLTSGNVLSRETALEKLAQDFEIEDIEEEVRKVNSQKEFNTFGF